MRVVEVVELRKPDEWPFESWRCDCGETLGHWLSEDFYGRERTRTTTPFVAVQSDGSTTLMCEDCAIELEQT